MEALGISKILDVKHFTHQGYYVGTCPNCGCKIHFTEQEVKDKVIHCCPTCDTETVCIP